MYLAAGVDFTTEILLNRFGLKFKVQTILQGLQYVYLKQKPLKNLNKDGRSTFCVPYLFESSPCRAKVPLALVPKFEFLTI